jgi:anhydro-N-acetylmuramic acid kinase
MSHARIRMRLVLGMMSGTSADGIDVALVRVADGAVGERPAHLENFAAFPLPAGVRAAVLRLAEGVPVSSAEASQLNFRVGQVFASAALRACRKFRVNPRRIAFIGSHGQTVYHQGISSSFLGARVASTLQIGEPAVIAALTGITTVGDFRPADMAVGGQGAPLVPFVDYLLYRDAKLGRVALNIGGIANVTVIPRAARPSAVFAFDTGPGNMILDGLVRHFTKGERAYDRDARMARAGQLLPELLAVLLKDPYFRRAPPKTAGREQFGAEYVNRIIAWGNKHRSRGEDLLRTATEFTAASIINAFRRSIAPRARISQLIVSGGGVRNPLIMELLSLGLSGIQVLSSNEMRVPADAKEAFAFALLANETMNQRPSNLPSATGASRPAILGKICYAPPR